LNRHLWLMLIILGIGIFLLATAIAAVAISTDLKSLPFHSDAKDQNLPTIAPTPSMNLPGRGIEIEDVMGIFIFHRKFEGGYECGYIEFKSDHLFTFVRHVDTNLDRTTDYYKVIKGSYEVARDQEGSPGFLLKSDEGEPTYLQSIKFEGMHVSSFTYNSLSFRLKGAGEPLFDWSGDTQDLAKTLKVESVPDGAAVYIDGIQSEGTTPLSIPDLSANVDHVIRAEYPGYANDTIVIKLDKDEIRLIRLRLAKSGSSGLSVVTDPTCIVIVDGEKLGWTPFQIDNYPAGNHNLTVINDSFNLSHSWQIQMDAGKTVEIDYIFTGKLSLDVGRRAAVYLKKKKIGITPFTNLDVPVGRHKLEVVDEQLKEAIVFADILPDKAAVISIRPKFHKPSK